MAISQFSHMPCYFQSRSGGYLLQWAPWDRIVYPWATSIRLNQRTANAREREGRCSRLGLKRHRAGRDFVAGGYHRTGPRSHWRVARHRDRAVVAGRPTRQGEFAAGSWVDAGYVRVPAADCLQRVSPSKAL